MQSMETEMTERTIVTFIVVMTMAGCVVSADGGQAAQEWD